ncbi:hypothetical protein [Nocardioides aurantiacus]|uniref:hypothetical protein n=1 Tax=Nocardioides aurantiacus TaxID=86796 RepID=UPI001FE56B61|nr:hypothetical protein [Nocardioides aurantiacus]
MRPARRQLAGRGGVRAFPARGRRDQVVLVLLGSTGRDEASGLTEAEYRSQVPARIGLAIPLARPGRRTRDLTKPAMFCVCDHDTVAPAATTLRHTAKAPQGEVHRYQAGHFDIYGGENFERVISDQLRFLRRHVPSRLGGSTQPDVRRA